MVSYADTSFFFRMYDTGSDTAKALKYVSLLEAPLPVSDLQRFEFMQAVRLRMFRFSNDRTEGLSRQSGARILEQF